MKSFLTASAVFLSLGSTVYGQSSIAKSCPPNTKICYSLNIPESTVSSGNGDIYFQITAPTTYQWVALGQGSSMSDSNIFVIYTSENGKNVTLSPRLGTGHVEPQYDTSAQIELLAGSGVSGGVMTANVKCGNCNSWSGGKMDFGSSSSDWIYAYKEGSSLATDDVEASITRHDEGSAFQWSLANAKGGDNVNPFVAHNAASTGTHTGSGSSTATSSCVPRPASATAASQTLASPTGSGCPTAWPSEYSTAWPTARPTWAKSCYPSGSHSWPTAAPYSKETVNYCDDTDSSNSTSDSTSSDGSATFSNNGAPFGGDSALGDRISTIHGVLAALAFVAIFPLGGILIRIASFSNLVWVHAALQGLGQIIYIIAFGMGIWLASEMDLTSDSHPILGIVIFILLLMQPMSGFIHHKMFKKTGGRTIISFVHLGVGRLAIVLGLINGGKGLNLAGASSGAKVAYAVCAAIVGLVYVVCVVFGELRKRRNTPQSYMNNPRHQLGSRDGSQPPIHLTEQFSKERH